MIIPRHGMVGAFTFNGKHTSEFQCVSRSISRPLLPEARVKRVEIPTMSGVQDFDNLEYGLRLSTFRLMYIGKDYRELRSRAREIAAWLTTPNWAKLILDDEPDVFQWAKIVSEIDFNHFLESGAIDCAFECQPFAQSIEDMVVEGTPTSFRNPGTRHVDFRSQQGSALKITAQVTGPATFVVGDRALNYNSTQTGELIIDSIKMAVTLNGVNAFPVMTGAIDRFFKVIHGNNNYQIAGANSPELVFTPLWY